MTLLEIFMKIVLCVTVTDELSRLSSQVFLQESKVSCSRAKPIRLSFSFLWIQVWNHKKDCTRVKLEGNMV